MTCINFHSVHSYILAGEYQFYDKGVSRSPVAEPLARVHKWRQINIQRFKRRRGAMS